MTTILAAKNGQKRAAKPHHSAIRNPPIADAQIRRAAMTWGQRLKRVFGSDIDESAGQSICTAPGCREAIGYMEVLDEHVSYKKGWGHIFVQDPKVIDKVLTHQV